MDQTQLQAQELERLAGLERALADAYDIAMNKVNDVQLIETLTPFRRRHSENAQVLEQLIQSQQQTLQLDESFQTYLEEVLDTIGDAVRRDEALGELRLAEAGLQMTYGQALQVASDAPANVLEHLMQEEAEHVRVLDMAHQTAKQ